MKNWFIKLRSLVLVFLTHQIALPMLKIFRRPNVFPYEKEELKKFPKGSLGNDLYVFLENRNLQLLKHYARHDLKHIVLDYDTTDEGEACLQSFMPGNGRISFPVVATVLYCLITMPEHWKKMKIAFQKGKHSVSIHYWSWNKLLFESTIELRNKIFNHT